VPCAGLGPGGAGEARIGAGQRRGHGGQQGWLVALDDHQVVGVLVFHQVAGGFRLSMQGVEGDHGAGEVQVRDGGCQFGNLVGLGIDLPLRADPPGADGEDGQQVYLAAVAADRAADGLAVRGCLLQQARRGRLGGSGPALLTFMHGDGGQAGHRAGGKGGEVAVQGCIQRLGVDDREDPGEGTGAGRADPPRPRISPPAQDGQRVLRAAGRPLGDRGRRVVPGRGERAHRQPQHILQRMPPAQRRAVVRDPGQPLAQAAARRVVTGGQRPGLARRHIDQGR
jgi:hypothetical protein